MVNTVGEGGTHHKESPHTRATLSLEEIQKTWLGEVETGLESACNVGGILDVMGRFHLATGGKRLRALLPIWICHNLGGDAAKAVGPGIGLELLHNATLVHDDVQDRDEVRRGQPTIWRRWGDAQAINSGDALYFQGIRSISSGRGLSAEEALRCVEIASASLLRLIAGQAMEFQLQRPKEDPNHLESSLENYTQMARGKTAALFAACFGIGAVVAGAPDKVGGAMDLGEKIGLLFQVQDDYLDLVGEKGRDRRGSDLAEGKLSFPVLWALTHSNPSDISRISAIVTAPRAETTDAMLQEGITLLKQCGALDATARWLLAAGEEINADPLSWVVPGLSTQILRPVAHALGL